MLLLLLSLLSVIAACLTSPFSKIRNSNAFKMNSDVTWDDTKGIWIDSEGNPAVKVDGSLESHEPLFVFGYGSLIWKPGDLLENYPSFEVDCLSHDRVFAQLSNDHRGNERYAGLVCTLQKRKALEEDDLCIGKMYLVPDEDKKRVLEGLDYREKGGYTRTVIDVRIRAGQETPFHSASDVCRAVVYYGEEGNPNFFQKASGRLDNKEDSVRFTANIISAAVGPSGPNSEYLMKLSHTLYEKQLADMYLVGLSRSVYLRSCVWTLLSQSLMGTLHHFLEVNINNNNKVYGVGSNEQGQLRLHDSGEEPVMHLSQAVQLDRPLLLDQLATRDPASYYLVAGGASGGLLDIQEKKLSLWGQIMQHFSGKESGEDCIHIPNIETATLGHTHGIALHVSGRLLCFGDDTHRQCSDAPGHYCTHLLALNTEMEEYYTVEHVHGKVLKASAGMRHSALITTNGYLYTWGNSKFGQVVPDTGNGLGIWQHPEGKKLIDVCCGAKFTAVLDCEGDVFVFGKNSHNIFADGEVTRLEPQTDAAIASEMTRLPSLDSSSQWVSLKCGWSHLILKGISPQGEEMLYGWGRDDMQQYVSSETSTECSSGQKRVPLALPPSGNYISEVWCGSEMTVIADCQGLLWYSGWQDDGIESNASSSVEWKPLLKEDGGHMQAHSEHGGVFSGHVACGGAHTFCIASR
jgi:glutathione-specific gamma-glutamylcyclotransferase